MERTASSSNKALLTVFTSSLYLCVSDGFPRWTDDHGDRMFLADPAGKQVVLRCPAAGFPSPNITWIKDGRIFEERRMGQVRRLSLRYILVHNYISCM